MAGDDETGAAVVATFKAGLLELDAKKPSASAVAALVKMALSPECRRHQYKVVVAEVERELTKPERRLPAAAFMDALLSRSSGTPCVSIVLFASLPEADIRPIHCSVRENAVLAAGKYATHAEHTVPQAVCEEHREVRVANGPLRPAGAVRVFGDREWAALTLALHTMNACGHCGNVARPLFGWCALRPCRRTLTACVLPCAAPDTATALTHSAAPGPQGTAELDHEEAVQLRCRGGREAAGHPARRGGAVGGRQGRGEGEGCTPQAAQRQAQKVAGGV